jgi:hypothetical protein
MDDYSNNHNDLTKDEILEVLEAMIGKLELLEENQKTLYDQAQDLRKNGLLSPRNTEQLTKSLGVIQKESMTVYNERLMDILQNAQATRTKLFEKVNNTAKHLEKIDKQQEITQKMVKNVETSANKIYTWRTAIIFALAGPACGALVATITVPWMINSTQPNNSELMKRLTNIENKLKTKK